jgi:hypothetical protein
MLDRVHAVVRGSGGRASASAHADSEAASQVLDNNDNDIDKDNYRRSPRGSFVRGSFSSLGKLLTKRRTRYVCKLECISCLGTASLSRADIFSLAASLFRLDPTSASF